MPDGDEKSLEELFRAALREARADADSDLLVGALLSSAVDTPSLQLVAEEELAPDAAELELHLDGGDVRDHATNAKSFGVFVTSMADASKEYAKSMLRLGAMSAPLRIAPGPGSVRATFIAPMPHERADERHTPLTAGVTDDRVWTESDVYSDSLWAIANVFSNAEPEPDSAALDGIIQSIPFRARTQLRKVAEQVAARDWQITGRFQKQGLGSHGVSLTSRGAKHLAEQLAVQDVHRTQWNTSGAITGHRWDKGLMFFAADDRARTFAASFESSDLEQRVAQLATVEDRRVEARFTIYTAIGRGVDEGRRSYVLEAIYPTVADAELDLPIADRPV
ncbi:hypothetical protein DEJ21_00790 [Curtobacterium sp. MCSS17_006]|jgi:hypothetical protein|nr:hypothetical protein [Curtobacterium flaccumfaciens]MDQ0537705.1 hypothetical protein [Curtobacterium flaccumfaciens]PZE40543.1 hypothetical protein DEJ21_00790 [Curtobacterium sp. MCSS17_006]ROR36652.1 hypothetical protein EDF63_0782 [Curtobacterium sp. JUb34]